MHYIVLSSHTDIIVSCYSQQNIKAMKFKIPAGDNSRLYGLGEHHKLPAVWSGVQSLLKTNLLHC